MEICIILNRKNFFIDFAKNEEGTEKNKMFDATVALFKKLWGQYASKEDGLYIGNKTY